MSSYPLPTHGASLLLAFRSQTQTQRPVLIVGCNVLAASRAFSALEANYSVVVLSPGGSHRACDELRWRAEQQQVTLLDFEMDPSSTDADASSLKHHLDTTGASLVFITDTLSSCSARRSRTSAASLASLCRARGVPINVTDMPDLCDFTVASAHRFTDTDGACTPLQVAVVTNGQGCRLSSRIRRDIVASLPRAVGGAVARVGQLRALAKGAAHDADADAWVDEDSAPTPNRPVAQRAQEESVAEHAGRRMRWVAQVSEYWPYARLAVLSAADMESVLSGDGLAPVLPSLPAPVRNGPAEHAGDSELGSPHGLVLDATAPCPPGRIYLLGSGPGHPGLLTVATRDVLTRRADVVLSDKLVPEAVLRLIPDGVDVRIARKFPGNAEGAQNEMMEAAVELARKGLTVVRLKQGDPTVYGRAGEEVLYFRQHGLETVLIPGVSSALAGPVFAGIPVTQRGAAESLVVCTGVGRQGRAVVLPGYERPRTLIVLMGVARLAQLLDTLTAADMPRRAGAAYPLNTPIAIIERASMPDQRALVSTLAHIAEALESCGEQRPPGMIVIGWAVLSLAGNGCVDVLEDDAEAEDDARVVRWLGGKKWRVSEGLPSGWDDL
ncbi:tetrapyrrole methylase [Vararia minispora EC-137]|uniref:Tetrapyrrole methylase n=1 Tax=Vararia minispora EC-137 TaxID=1314806 RepID=A0ACB8Q6G0_9AGAM|nr:tetrapyrrole methylase [Vararia minispora EC-137]